MELTAGSSLPLTKIATGFVFAFGALRFNGFDLLFDPVGWGLCASGLTQLLHSAGDPFDRARSFAVAMVSVSLVAVFASGVPHPSDEPASFSLSQVIGLVDTAGALIAVWLTVDAIIRRIRPHGEISTAARLDVLRWAVVSLGVLGILSGFGHADLGFVTPIAWFVAVVALIVVLYRAAGLPWLFPTEERATG
ncbi:hypothetical protein MTP10_01990 [Nonomuraea sp. 3-1Str]|uniref:hypothetical protein n=1 Tax=Nonomuraea sp. 3-1Str TaxID=2929801 RepID=UPI0028551E0F|nr:hypothetical protein [Nonomuraea sp. 3-1Str]MDR8407507.1 hypothetical protein [Nonomuraea sp. 3-1Str]